ncbi:P-loop containing nucleoside triphosphate hydrolase protein [Artomyces pyxidatus]|uniref:P-loop containing nucleoside triphosphate hydrolase protein n=1 Tax=Artomyces pyxidatus TaxID=48021 RepID=A0ACB8SUZ9_9AGAM|nr:P-loop containing nucleoside triphosphate hydrolase protein [Artomyces pyxidatus]
MLDHCSIFHKGGLVLRSRSFTPPAVSQLATSTASQWTFVNDLELIFVVAYQHILQLTYVDNLLAALKTLFVKLFEPFLATFVASFHAVNSKAVEKATVDQKYCLRPSTRPAIESPIPGSSDVDTDISHNVQDLKSRLRGRGGRHGARAMGRTDSGRDSHPGSEYWGDEAPTESDMASLDFRYDKLSDVEGYQGSLDVQALLQEDTVAQPAAASGSLRALGSIFARLTVSKVVSEEDLKPVLEAMKQHLMKKNVAKDMAEKVCEGVATNAAVLQAFSNSITRILTPKASTDLLLCIRTKLSSPLASTQQRMPYSITSVGVNGVRKSTHPSKICFWLIQNDFRALIAACDTFRGAVEQPRMHVRNLGMLGVNGAGDSKGRVELSERGYGKDAAGIAEEAIAYGRGDDFDVVLIDTAGRMQDDEPLMRALANPVSVNNPDKILFVGKALVRNEAVDQLTNSGAVGKGRGIDGTLVTKWDTVDDKVGATLSMTYVTDQPIVFGGTGQTYTDLRQLRVANVV